MHFDFAALLVIAAAVTGLIWLFDALVLARRRTRTANAGGDQAVVDGTGHGPHLPWYIDFSRSFFPVIVAVLILRSFIVEPFRIPSGSMEPTLYDGDFILVNKFAYGLRLPVWNNKIVEWGEPERGDVIVFRFPDDPKTAFIKRIVGLPGDSIEYRKKELYINGEKVPLEGIEIDNVSARFDVFNESLGEQPHMLQITRGERRGRTATYQVPQGNFFVMGDNRDNSHDSRKWGFMPEENLIGNAFFIWMNWNCITFNGNCNRIGRSIE